jgi:hypothetical protein
MKRKLGTVAAFLAIMALLLGISSAPAWAYDHTYQVPSDNKTHAFIGSEPWMENANADGCHLTGSYGSQPQRLLYCVWMGIDNTLYPSSYEDDIVFAIKFRCYDSWSGDATVCSSVDFTANWTWQAQPGFPVYRASYRDICHSIGGPGGCMGYPGSGTFTNNTGWLVYENTAAGSATHGTAELWQYTHAYSSDAHFNGVNVGIANSDIWRITDGW